MVKLSAYNRLTKAIPLMERSLVECTNLDELSRKKVMYYTLATHSLPHLQIFPVLSVRGKTGTGKSAILNIIGNYARAPRYKNLRGTTTPLVRDEMDKAQDGTLILEEGDQSQRNQKAGASLDPAKENLISDRTMKNTAVGAVNRKVETRSGDAHKPTDLKYFGATVIHQRHAFNDTALETRTIIIRTKANHNRTYLKFNPGLQPWAIEGHEIVTGLSLTLNAPETSGRAEDMYGAVLELAKLVGDDDFIAQVRHEELEYAKEELVIAQAAEPDGLIVAGIIAMVAASCDPVFTPNFPRITMSQLREHLFKNDMLPYTNQGLSSEVRALGFDVRPTGGHSTIYPTPISLLKAAEQAGYQDEFLDQIKLEVNRLPKVSPITSLKRGE